MTATNQPIKISRFDVASYLADEATIQAYLNEMLESGTPAEFVQALNDVARARGMNDVAKGANMGRTTLYKTLQSEKPRFESLAKVLDSLGLQLQVVSKHA
ncbi:addiction module antidote protein [Moraxella osloensis]|uniref:addiction module antidote protein n=1 Tax=Faucicola osloensis TaxID=34062 RepID=UPI00242CC5BA|nr:addiction module antidote protein [Moraxella osloensis]